MQITLSPSDYATAFRLLTERSRHPEHLADIILKEIAPRLPERPSLLDIGAGPGKLDRLLAPHFASLTLLEPNRAQLPEFDLPNARLFHTTLEAFETSETYDLVVCAHVLYHVPLAEWSAFLDRVLGLVRPGGHCVLALTAPRGQSYEVHHDFLDDGIFSDRLLRLLRDEQRPHTVVETRNVYTTSVAEEMYILLRFLVLENCFTPALFTSLSEEDARRMADMLRGHVEHSRGPDGVHRLEQIDDVILLPPP
ncbi:class I SAM-dependent methyltransferase [Chondromyces crocatus]|uniref:Class I SAM-dependent methyltransferase n=1 Tax=Chondromyces crocatus TaxID=52 RepID=A0A0K1EQG4_CHOCO|nr:class I SAM-dependent methyltransferase [Chondromyces crocatus]AKT42897.1 uncharacterized protein CMC5_071250 [Chondromyces crocatus]